MIVGIKLDSQRQILRNLFANGGDVEYHVREDSGLTSFSWSCIKGDTKAVERQHLSNDIKP